MRETGSAAASLLRTIIDHARDRTHCVAIHCGKRSHDYGKLWRRVERVTAHLSATYSVQAGDRVATLADNDDLQLVLLFACMRLGAIWVPLDRQLEVRDLHDTLADAAVRLLVVDALHTGPAEAVCSVNPELRCVLLERLIDRPAPYGHVYPLVAGTLPALLLFGTDPGDAPTLYTQDMLCVANADIDASDNVLTALPLAHFAGLMRQALPALQRGATVTLLPRFDADTWLAAVVQHRPTLAALTLPMLERLMEAPGWALADFSSLRRVILVDAAPALAIAAEADRRGLPLKYDACPDDFGVAGRREVRA